MNKAIEPDLLRYMQDWRIQASVRQLAEIYGLARPKAKVYVLNEFRASKPGSAALALPLVEAGQFKPLEA